MKNKIDAISRKVYLDIIFKLPILNKFIKYLLLFIFPGSKSYWEHRYKNGRDSGSGSYNRLAKFKADVVNSFIKEKKLRFAIEFGCGDGNQLSLIEYPHYIGLDISPTAIKKCINRFANDKTKSFFLYDTLCFADNHNIFKAEISLSLDVIFHLTEDDIFSNYMKLLFASSRKYVMIYSSNHNGCQVYHQKNRKFTDWINQNEKKWKLIKIIINKYPQNTSDSSNTSKSDFYIFKKSNKMIIPNKEKRYEDQ